MNSRNSSQDPNYVGPVGHEKKMYKDRFGPLDLHAPKCKNYDCNRVAWMGEYCPKHKPLNEKDAVRG